MRKKLNNHFSSIEEDSKYGFRIESSIEEKKDVLRTYKDCKDNKKVISDEKKLYSILNYFIFRDYSTNNIQDDLVCVDKSVIQSSPHLFCGILNDSIKMENFELFDYLYSEIYKYINLEKGLLDPLGLAIAYCNTNAIRHLKNKGYVVNMVGYWGDIKTLQEFFAIHCPYREPVNMEISMYILFVNVLFVVLIISSVCYGILVWVGRSSENMEKKSERIRLMLMGFYTVSSHKKYMKSEYLSPTLFFFKIRNHSLILLGLVLVFSAIKQFRGM